MAKSEIYHKLAVTCVSHTYPIYIGDSLLLDMELLQRHIEAEQVLIVTNDTLAPFYLTQVRQAFSSLQCDVVVLPDGERHKNEQNLFTIYDTLIQNNHHRDTTLLALGGGVIGDITGFAAATYQRGVRFIQLPTTLLAQVDASIGGKTAINHPSGKNMIGSFHQPQAVVIDLATLTTLPLREFRAGLAEVIKYALLVGGDFPRSLQALLASELSHSLMRPLANLIAQCCSIKAEIVQEDERERGCRALLNLGHTFAHALEACTHFQRWLHGEAVAIGLYCAALLSHQLGYLDKASLDRIDSLLEMAKLPRRIPADIHLLDLQAQMFKDKKVKNKTLHFVLMRAPGDCFIETDVTEKSLRQTLIEAVQGGG